ncbi:hemerythrin domain-containing protein [Paraburkholderia xenovorans]|nr:hemerythrin domain-containing protein [Paraburkholderia xenovorans]
MKEQEIFSWNDGFKLGYSPMDKTHEEFVEIVNTMLTCSDSKLAQHLDSFVAHAEDHFSQELCWMKETDFPNTACHAEQHDAVMHSVREVREHLRTGGDPEAARRLAAALAEWFPGHADYLDAALAQWMVKKRVGAVPIVLRRNLGFREDKRD